MNPGYVEEDRVDRLHLLGAHRPRLEHRSVQGDSQGRRAGSLFVIAGVDLPPITAPVMAHAAGASPPVRWLRSGDGVKSAPVLDRRSSLSCGDLERQQRPTSRDPKPHERDRLKDVGRRGRGKTVKVAKNGEDGTARGWKPATRNLHRTQRTVDDMLIDGPMGRPRRSWALGDPGTCQPRRSCGDALTAVPGGNADHDGAGG